MVGPGLCYKRMHDFDLLSFFAATVTSTALYGREVWGVHPRTHTEQKNTARLHNKYLCQLLLAEALAWQVHNIAHAGVGGHVSPRPLMLAAMLHSSVEPDIVSAGGRPVP